MDKNAMWKWLILFVLVGLSLFVVMPIGKKIQLGIDLKGGTSFTVQVDEEKMRLDAVERFAKVVNIEERQRLVDEELVRAKKDAKERALEVLRNRIDTLGIAEPDIHAEGEYIIIQLPGVDKEKRAAAKEMISQVAYLEFRLVNKNNQELTAKILEKGLAPEGYVLSGDGQSYRVDSSFDVARKDDKAYSETLRRFNAPSAEYDFMLMKDTTKDKQTIYKPVFVNRRAEMNGSYIENARGEMSVNMTGYEVDMTFSPAGAKMFSTLTGNYCPRGEKNADPVNGYQLAIVLDGTLYSAPVLRERISGGRAQITGSFTVSEAQMLANVLKAGSLPAPVKILEERMVDPTLGADAVKSGISSGIYGLLAILVLMALYYMVSGLLADVALILNVILLPLGMIAVAGFLGVFLGNSGNLSKVVLPVLTLPGIAGIALSIGMAVDANVLIFERIREELTAGKGLVGAITAGYERAFTAIFDSNATTILVAVILFYAGGSGPVRGYAITLAAGLIVSLFTAVVVTRMCYGLIARKATGTGVLKMMQAFKPTQIDFMRMWKIPLGISVLIIVVTWGVMLYNTATDKSKVFGVDFVGGTSLSLGFEKKMDVETLRAAVESVGVKGAIIQYQQPIVSQDKELLKISVNSAEAGVKVQKVLMESFPDAGLVEKGKDVVLPQISDRLKSRAMWAMIAALVVMTIYIAVRFEFGFALGAVAALFHDVLITAGLCHVFGFPMTLTMVAALMTIVGYSVNDTIVIFDRIREDLKLVRNKSFTEVCNLAMNQTLSRTLLTNGMTFVCVFSLFFLGGGSIRDFSAAMLIGMIAGTYSTIYIATPVVLMWYGYKTPELASKTPT